eukprot:35649_1
MLEHFFILDTAGTCIFTKNYKDEGGEIDLNMIMGLSSSMSSLTSLSTAKVEKDEERTSGHGMPKFVYDQCILVLNGKKFLFMRISPFTLILQAEQDDSDDFMKNQMADIGELLGFYLGNLTNVSDVGEDSNQTLVIEGTLDFVETLIEKHQNDQSFLCRGIQLVSLNESIREHLDRLLASLEGNEKIIGSALLLGNSVLHSRLPMFETRMILLHLSARPLGLTRIRIAPVYLNSKWNNMCLIKLRSNILAVLSSMNCSFSELEPYSQEFEDSLALSPIQLPTEEPPVLLRHFTGPDTIAFIHRNRRTGYCISASPNLGLRSEKDSVMNAFSWFHSKICGMISESSIDEVLLFSEDYRFHGKIDEKQELFCLYNSKTSIDSVKRYTAEIQRNCVAALGNFF